MQNHSVKFKSFKFSVIAFSFYLSAFTFSGVCWSLGESGAGNPAIRNPIGPPTVPQSSIRSGMTRSPIPTGLYGNLVVTGNVGGGKHFRGVVPYNAISDFESSLGSSSLDSFLRRSAGLDSSGRYTGKLTPYFSQTRTVTTTRMGYSRVIKPPTAKISGAVDRYALPGLSDKQKLAYRQPAMPSARFRPMSARPQELQKVFLSEVEKYLQRIKSTSESAKGGRQEQINQFQQDLKQVSERAAELKQDLLSQDSSVLSTKLEPVEPRPSEGLGEDVRAPFEIPAPEEQKSEYTKLDVYEQMKKQAEDLQEIIKESAAAKEADPPRRTESKTKEGEPRPSEGLGEESSQADKLAEISMSVARAKAVLGEHKSFACFSEDKFNQHMAIAEDYLKQGKYYCAADAYTMASIYKPGDPLAYAGKSHALFAAGEYMSSALFLSRALAIFPEYAQFKIDLVAMVGDRDTLESRIADVGEWLERNDAAELQFLLGYIYYQMGRLEPAKEAIEAAYEKMPDSQAVITLRKAIND